MRSNDRPVDAASPASTSFHAARPRRLAWDTRDVRPAEQFAFYHEAVCKAFMTLSPEAASQASFSSRIESIRIGDAAINRVVFPAHTVRRSAADIAASTSRCYYLNLMLAGRCRIQQGDRDVDLAPGQVALFDSGRQFSLLHAGSRSFAVDVVVGAAPGTA